MHGASLIFSHHPGREWSNSAVPSSLAEFDFRGLSSKKVRKKFDQNKHFPEHLRAPEGAERLCCIEYGKVSKHLNDWAKEES
jgi:hypothetical protein